MSRPSKKPAKGFAKGNVGGPEVVTVNIKDLVRDPAFQVRQKINPGVVQSYANVLANDLTLPPIRLAHVGKALIVVDGWHRIAAHERRELQTIEAEIVVASAREAKWIAASANFSHGLPLNKKEVRTAFGAMIRARRHIIGPKKLRSYRELAALLGGRVRHTTVTNWMKADFPEIAKRMSKEDPGCASREAERDEEKVFQNSFDAAIASARANAPAVRNPQRRWEMVQAVKDLLAAVEGDGDMAPPDPCEF